MVKKILPKKVTTEVKDYVRILREDDLPISKVIVYGSYAKGNQHKWSDIDVCIVSPSFTDTWEAMQYLWLKRQKNSGLTIEPIGFGVNDFKDKSSLINEIKKFGVEVKV